MYYTTINKERLERYLDSVQELDKLYKQKHGLEKRLGLHSVDLSKTKVTCGSKPAMTEPEQYARNLERINKEITKLKAFITPEHKELVTQIGRLKKHVWRKAITYKYIEGLSISEITQQEFCGYEDYEETCFNKSPDGKLTYIYGNKYQKQVERWLESGIENLQIVSEKPFIKVSQQLVIEGLDQ